LIDVHQRFGYVCVSLSLFHFYNKTQNIVTKDRIDEKVHEENQERKKRKKKRKKKVVV